MQSNSLKNSFLTNKQNSISEKIDDPITSIMSNKNTPKETLKQSRTKIFNTVAETTTSFLNIKNIIFFILIILFLAFLGFNIFNYFASGTNIITNLLSPIISLFGTLSGDTAKIAINNTSSGSKTIVDNTSKTTQTLLDNVEQGSNTGINFLQDNLKKTAQLSNNNSDALTLSIVNTANADKLTSSENTNVEPEPTKTNSLNQGYCYIGKINDTRYCGKVSNREQCMSGDIYPSMDICINPNLRS